jgi:hypothetical protein
MSSFVSGTHQSTVSSQISNTFWPSQGSRTAPQPPAIYSEIRPYYQNGSGNFADDPNVSTPTPAQSSASLNSTVSVGSAPQINSCQRYSLVKVLLIHWARDGDLRGCTGELEALESKFQCYPPYGFGFQTEIVSIWEEVPDEVFDHVRRFFTGASSSELLIVYYAGHAVRSPSFQLQRFVASAFKIKIIDADLILVQQNPTNCFHGPQSRPLSTRLHHMYS